MTLISEHLSTPLKMKHKLIFILAASLSACSHLPRDIPTQSDPKATPIVQRHAQAQAAFDTLTQQQRKTADGARAQCFIQHAYSEHHENDRSGFTEQALSQAQAITQALQNKQPAPATQLISHPERMRSDLWKQAEQLKTNACAQATAGCLEVQLVRAGHEHHTMGWRHANSYFAIAEDMAAQAQTQAKDCPPGQPVEPPPKAPQTQTESLTLNTDVLFKYNQYKAQHALPAGLRQLDEVAKKLKSVKLIRVELTGHTDTDGPAPYNDKLGLRRAKTVRALLIERGVKADFIHPVESRGEREPIKVCSPKLKPQTRYACNQANRRVVMVWVYEVSKVVPER
jgi:outer membrane protein OmpA-like peptidoglycan-associated protein